MPTRILVTGWVLLLYAIPAAAQGDQLSHSAYLQQIGQLDAAAGIEQWLRDELAVRRPDWPVEKQHQNAAFFAFILTVTGMTPEMVASVEAHGVDVIHGITENSRPFIEQALLADVVVVGDVTASEADSVPNDGFGFSDRVAVQRVLKGETPGRTITIRRREVARARDIAPEVGKRYLLLLSGGMYQFAAARHRAGSAGSAIAAPPGHYSIYRIYEMVDGRLLWNGFSEDETASAFEEIQLLDELLSAAKR